MEFSEEQINRYSRHILLPEVGGKGQKKIAKAKVFIVGAGGLGSPVALYLAAAGVGTLGLIDSDVVDLSNLQRQVLHHTPDINRPKVTFAKEKILALNPDVKVETYEDRLTSRNALDLISQYDIVIDGVDNFPAKFLINDACFFAKKPLVHGGILKFDGRVFTIIPDQSACYRCIFKEPPPPGKVPSCQEAGIIGGEVEYMMCQPWPFPNTLMIGVHVKAKTKELTIDPHEIADAKWIHKDDVKAILDGDDSYGILLPKKIAISRNLLEAWL